MAQLSAPHYGTARDGTTIGATYGREAYGTVRYGIGSDNYRKKKPMSSLQPDDVFFTAVRCLWYGTGGVIGSNEVRDDRDVLMRHVTTLSAGDVP